MKNCPVFGLPSSPFFGHDGKQRKKMGRESGHVSPACKLKEKGGWVGEKGRRENGLGATELGRGEGREKMGEGKEKNGLGRCHAIIGLGSPFLSFFFT